MSSKLLGGVEDPEDDSCLLSGPPLSFTVQLHRCPLRASSRCSMVPDAKSAGCAPYPGQACMWLELGGWDKHTDGNGAE